MSIDNCRPPPGKRPRSPLALTDGERAQLEIWRENPGKSLHRAKRARVILALATTTNAKQVAPQTGVTLWTVYAWRSAFQHRRLMSFLSFLK